MGNNIIRVETEKINDTNNYFSIKFKVNEIDYWELLVKFRNNKSLHFSSKNLNEELNSLIKSIEYIKYTSKAINTLSNWIEQLILTKEYNPGLFKNELITIESILKIIENEVEHNLKNHLTHISKIY